MVREIKTVARIIEIGNSVGIIIGKDEREVLALEKDNYIQLSIRKIGIEDNEESGKPISTIAKIINIGNSIGVTISKDVKNILKLKKRDYIQLSITKLTQEQ